jgi:hypothetical protein
VATEELYCSGNYCVSAPTCKLANERVRRLYKLVEDGVTEFDNVLKDCIIAAQPSLAAWAHPEGRVHARPIKRTEP